MSDAIVPINLESVSGEHRASSEVLAVHLDIQHKNLLSNIRKYASELESFGPLAFQTRVGKSLPQGGKAKDTEYALLNEPQCTFLLSLSKNNQRTIELKKNLTQSFHAMKRHIESAKSDDTAAQLVQFMQQQQLFNQQMMQQMMALTQSIAALPSPASSRQVTRQTSHSFCRVYNIHVDHSPTLASKAKIIARAQKRLGEVEMHPHQNAFIFPVDILEQAKRELNLTESD